MFSAAYTKRLATALCGAALASAMAVSGASADPHAIDTHNSAVAEAQAADTYQDLRSPDAVDAARAAGGSPEVAPPPSSIAASAGDGYQDLRSPETRGQAEGYNPTPESQPVVDEPSEPAGFDLTSAAIGAVAAGGLSLLLMAILGMRRPAGRRPASA
jgi:hypothetical protein